MFTVEIKKSAIKELERLTPQAQAQLAPVIRSLKDFPSIPNIKKLTNHPGYRIRSGDYRIVFTLDQDAKRVFVIAIANRKDIYRR